MANRIEQEVNKTLECLPDIPDIEVSPLFADKISSRLAHLRTPGRAGYRSRGFYPAVIALLIVLNVAAVVTGLGRRGGDANQSATQYSALAEEYGIDTNSAMNF